jgi:multidrug efflux pump subunit AcrB
VNAAEWSIRNNRTFSLLIALVVVLGVGHFLTMPRLEDPEFTIRTAIVITVLPGATPDKVERLVTDQLEKSIREMAEVETVLSESRNELSIIQVDVFEHHMEMGPIWQDLRNKVADTRPDLPQGIIGPLVNDEFGDVFGIVIALRGDGFSYRELKAVAEDVRNELLLVEETAKVEIWGEQQERIYIELSNARLAELGVSPQVLIQAIQARNALAPAASPLLGDESIFMEPTGEFKTVEEIRAMTLNLPGRARGLRLGDISEVLQGYVDPPEVMTRFNREPCLMLAVSMTDTGRITEFGERLNDRLEEISSRLPIGLEFSYLVFQPEYVEAAIGNFMINLYTAFGFVFLVMLLFAGFRTALIAGMLVPMAVLMSIALLYPFGIALQRVSIASLIISLGILVDNGVVVSESILVRLRAGEDRVRAIADTARELSLPLLAASLTTIFAFLPIATATDRVGEYTFSLFVVITLTLGASWILSMTFVPFLCHYFLQVKPASQTFQGRPYRLYRSALITVLKYRFVTTALVAILTAAALWAFQRVPETFFPPNERETLIIDFWQPYGTDIRATAARADRLEAFIMAQDGVVSVGSFIGSGGPRWYLPLDIQQNTPNYAFLVINTTTLEAAERLLDLTDRFIREQMPDTRADVKRLLHGPPVGIPIQVRLSGDDWPTLYELRNRIDVVLSDIQGVVDIWDDWGEWSKMLRIEVNQDKAQRVGVSSREIADSLHSLFAGIPISQFRNSTDLIPIVIRSSEPDADALARIGDLNVYAFSTGKSVPLAQIATVEMDWQPSNIQRRNARRTMTIKATISGRLASEIMAELQPALTALQSEPEWPAGYDIAYGGEMDERQRARSAIFGGLPLALALIMLTLVAKFNSFRKFMIIALTVPPAIIGITIGLFLTGDPFGFMALLGMISLTGIIINNAIILIGSIEDELGRGRVAQDAIVLAGQQRLRPIVMTAMTTMIGLMPLSFRGGEMWSPLANIIIFGLAFATLFTLGLCPILYALFYRVNFADYQYDTQRVHASPDA